MNSIHSIHLSTDTNTIDNLINDLGGCGRFQIILTSFVIWPKIVSAISMMMMAFGNYNPGWECLDNSTIFEANLSASGNKSNNGSNECILFGKCENIQFKHEVSTIVTEWHLVCDRAWISSLIISIQMFGVLVGSWLTGYLGDKIGRKSTLYASMVYHIVVNVIAIFSNSWQMFAVMRFFIGIAMPIMTYLPVVLALEFVPFKWRIGVTVLPAWSIGCIIFTLCAMATEDWKYLHVITVIASFISLLPGYWIPESLRWLVVKNKVKIAQSIVKNIAKVNKSQFLGTGPLQRIAKSYRGRTHSSDQSMLHLLKRGLRKPTLIIGFLFLFMSMTYYAISFGVKSLPGNFYTNLLIMYSSDFPIIFISGTLPNYTGRKVAIIIFIMISTACLFIIAGVDFNVEGSLTDIAILCCAILARLCVDAAWDTVITYTGEFYPTVIRSTSIAYSSLSARIGGILAPYLIPKNPDTFFINYIIMSILGLICCGFLFLLPSTKGQALQDTWNTHALDPIMENESTKDEKAEERDEVKL